MEAQSIEEYLARDERKDLLRLLTAGSVDDGKSTLIGRLLFDSKTIYEDQLLSLERDSKRMGNAGEHIDYALLLDGLKAEREQGITIDVAYRYFSTNKRKFIIADTPGHEQYTRNMITGGSTADLAIILIDARLGVITQTRRHTHIVALLGIRHVVLAVNKMDLVGFSQQVFENIADDYRLFVAESGLLMRSPYAAGGYGGIEDIKCIPLSALEGDNVVERSERTPYYDGPSLLEHLETVEPRGRHNLEDMRFPVQYVLRPGQDFRGFSGRVASGVIRKGDEVVALPSGKRSRIKQILTPDGESLMAHAPMSITLRLEDEIDLSRGEMLARPDAEPMRGRSLRAMMVWMDEEQMDMGKQYFLKHTTLTSRATIDLIEHIVDINETGESPTRVGAPHEEPAPHEAPNPRRGSSPEEPAPQTLRLNEIARVRVRTSRELFFDPYEQNRATGAFILIDPISNMTSAVGMIIGEAPEAAGRADTWSAPTSSVEPIVISLSRLSIGPEHREAIERVARELPIDIIIKE